MLSRRDFVRNLALIAAGSAALPEQISAFEKYYDVNTPQDGPFICVDEIMISGLSLQPLRILVEFLDLKNFDFSFDAAGNIFRWVAAPEQKIVASKFRWRLTSSAGDEIIDKNVCGHISYIDQSLKRHNASILDRQIPC